MKLSQERFELVTRATSDAIWDWNLYSDEIWWNDGIQKLFGYTPEEMGGDIKYWKALLHPDDAERVIRDIQLHIDTGKSKWTDEYRFKRKNGTYAHVIDRGYVVYDKDEMPVRMIGSMMDVTERKSLEDQLTHQALHDPLTNIANRALFPKSRRSCLRNCREAIHRLRYCSSISTISKLSTIHSAMRPAINY